MNKRIKELENALRTMVVATDFNAPLPKGHPGHEAYLNMVARPRAIKVLFGEKDRISVEEIIKFLDTKIDFPPKPNYLFVRKIYPSSGVDKMYKQQEQIRELAQAIYNLMER